MDRRDQKSKSYFMETKNNQLKKFLERLRMQIELKEIKIDN